jgi:hypothetical protein
MIIPLRGLMIPTVTVSAPRVGSIDVLPSSIAGAGGFEPPRGGSKGRCLTAWLRPKSQTQNITLFSLIFNHFRAFSFDEILSYLGKNRIRRA